MNDDDFYARIKEFYHPPKNKFSIIDIPNVRYMVIEGSGDPSKTGIEEAMQWLWAIVHFLAPIAKEKLGKKFAYPPLECLFWANDPKDFGLGNKDKWQWRTMVVLATWMTEEIFETAVAKAEKKRAEKAPSTLAIEHLLEGKSVQYLHQGDYAGVANVCNKLYGDYLPKNNLNPNGAYHEIYLNDPSRTETKQRKIIIRQPVKSATQAT